MDAEELEPAGPRRVLDYATPGSNVSLRGTGFLAVTATILFPGLGHWLARKWWRGAAWALAHFGCGGLMLVVMAVPAVLVGLFVVIPLFALVRLAMCVDAYRMARYTQPRLSPPSRYFLGGLILVIALVASPLNIAIEKLLLPHVVRHWVETFQLHGPSMAPNLLEHDRIFCHKRHSFGRWSVVVFETPGGFGAKGVIRVVGLPGETIAVINGQVYVDGQPVDQPGGVTYVDPAGPGSTRALHGWEGNPITLADDEFFLLGDNGPAAWDSRYFGAVPASAIEGPVTAIYWPPSRWGWVSSVR